MQLTPLKIQPDKMIYNEKENLLKLIEVENIVEKEAKRQALVAIKQLGSPEYVPPEELQIPKGNTADDISIEAADVYCWGMTFCSVLFNKSKKELQGHVERYKLGAEKYKGFEKWVESNFNLIETIDGRMLNFVKELLCKALRYKPKERPSMREIVKDMEEFERASTEEVKAGYGKYGACGNCGERIYLTVELACEHMICKDCLAKHALDLLTEKKAYNHYCYCLPCNQVEPLKGITLDCNCLWSNFSEKVKFADNLSYGTCHNAHPLTLTDLCLINDYISFKYTSLLLSNYPKYSRVSYYKNLKKESLESIGEILRMTMAVEDLDLQRKNVGAKNAEIISTALKVNKSLVTLDMKHNNIGDDGGSIISDGIEANKVLVVLDLGHNFIGNEGVKAIVNALRFNKTLTLSLIHISEPTRPLYISYAVFCLKKKNPSTNKSVS
eukprot:TRINITY_DN26175_c0_g1_i2.p1 TRINITY_DN26175_c0_g1~~TRINITY_DN26175_c0_g1_i2.p1  ORF type:complete len:441 (-),score=104.92 TRINITY_DN26175_c0_g1_i2:19-1341(-)